MHEIRKDPITSEIVIIATERENRPKDLLLSKNKKKGMKFKSCPFCIGNETLTPPEIYRDGDCEWNLRVVPNKYKALRIDNINAYGIHEVIIDSPHHNMSLGKMSIDGVKCLINTYINRFSQLKKHKKIKHVQIFKNYKKEAGASLEHPHSQVLAMPFIPSRFEKENNRAKRYYEKNYQCVYCNMIKDELSIRKRVVYENRNYVILAPFASKFKYETVILSKHHQSSIEQITNINDLSTALKFITEKMELQLNDPPYNLLIKTSTEDNDYYHWHIEIKPRLSIQAGLELSTGVFINTVSPEETAKFLCE